MMLLLLLLKTCNYVSNLASCGDVCAAGLSDLLENMAQLKIRNHLFLSLLLSSLTLYIVIITWWEKSKHNVRNSLSFRAGPFLQKWWRRLLKVLQFSLLGPPSCMAGPPFAFEDYLKQEICSCFNINRCMRSTTFIFLPNNHKSLSFLKIPLPQQHKTGSWTRCTKQQSLPLHYSPGVF